ncbi:hypothetical protein L7F22_032369 [Adiantum nelumboides]|nr:hypothetical protein [Adiantum nelumboides]
MQRSLLAVVQKTCPVPKLQQIQQFLLSGDNGSSCSPQQDFAGHKPSTKCLNSSSVTCNIYCFWEMLQNRGRDWLLFLCQANEVGTGAEGASLSWPKQEQPCAINQVRGKESQLYDNEEFCLSAADSELLGPSKGGDDDPSIAQAKSLKAQIVALTDGIPGLVQRMKDCLDAFEKKQRLAEDCKQPLPCFFQDVHKVWESLSPHRG